MAIFTVAAGNGAYVQLIVTEDSQSIPGNQTIVAWDLALFKGTTNPYMGSPGATWTVQINGVNYGGSFTFDFTGGATFVTIAVGTTPVTHNADGTKTITVHGGIGATGTSIGGPSGLTVPWALTTIPRASTPTFEKVSNPGVPITTTDAGIALKINTNRASSGFTHTLEYRLQGQATWNSIATGVGASYASWTVPLSLMNLIPNNTSGIVEIRTTTFSGATQIGQSTTNFTMTVPSSVIPTISSITDSEATTGLAANVGAYVQNLTKLLLGISGAAGAYSSTISSYKIEVNGQTINSSSGTTAAVISASGTVPILATVTDSRGRIGTLSKNVTVLAYSAPAITAITAQRALVSGVPDDDGTYIRVNINAAVQSLVVSTERNALVYKIYTRDHSVGGAWTLKATQTPGGVTFNSHYEVGTYFITSSWDVLVEILDDFSTTSVQLIVPTAVIFMDWNGSDGIGMGKFHQNGFLDVQGDIYQSGYPVVDFNDSATASFPGIVELATPAEVLGWTDTTRAVTPLGLAGAITSQRGGFKNHIINGRFRTNQRGYVSGASLASGDYAHDRWKANAATTSYTYLSDPQGGPINIDSGKGLQQIVERTNIPATTYTLSWIGDVVGRVYNVGGTPPAYAASPIVVALDGLADVVVEFSAVGAIRTLGNVQLELGDLRTSFEYIPVSEELMLCQRYYYVIRSAVAFARYFFGWSTAATSSEVIVQHPVPMRTSTPTISFNNLYWSDLAGNMAVSAIAIDSETTAFSGRTPLQITHATGATVARAGVLAANGTSNNFISFSAEL